MEELSKLWLPWGDLYRLRLLWQLSPEGGCREVTVIYHFPQNIYYGGGNDARPVTPVAVVLVVGPRR